MALKSGSAQFTSVQKGSLRGRRIPLPPAVHGHRHFTSAIMKEAFFQLVEPLKGSPFFDLCAGSGQIALEAISQGFSPVHCVERDTGRFHYLLKHFQGAGLVFHNKDFRRLSPLLAREGGVAFLDVPYTFWSRDGSCPHVEEFLKRLKSDLLETGASLVLGIQSPGPVRWADPEVESWIREDLSCQTREYRGHFLLILSVRGHLPKDNS